MRVLVWAATVSMALVGCAGQHKVELRPLHAAAGTSVAVSQQLEQGNQLFAQQDWAEPARLRDRAGQLHRSFVTGRGRQPRLPGALRR